MTTTHVLMMIVTPDTAFPISQLTVKIIIHVLMTGVMLILDANTTNTAVMIRTHVPMTLAMNILDVFTLLFLLMITTHVLTITAAQLMEFTTLKNQFLLMMLV